MATVSPLEDLLQDLVLVLVRVLVVVDAHQVLVLLAERRRLVGVEVAVPQLHREGVPLRRAGVVAVLVVPGAEAGPDRHGQQPHGAREPRVEHQRHREGPPAEDRPGAPPPAQFRRHSRPRDAPITAPSRRGVHQALGIAGDLCADAFCRVSRPVMARKVHKSIFQVAVSQVAAQLAVRTFSCFTNR